MMNKIIGKTPFFRLLLPVAVAIILSDKINYSQPLFIGVSLISITLILLSFYHSRRFQYNNRWFFGAGVFLFLFALTLHQCHDQRIKSEYNFPNTLHTYLATVLETPEEKERSYQCLIKTAPPYEKKIMLYMEKGDRAATLTPGDEIVLTLKPEPFRNNGNPGEWDYVRYMTNKNFAARGYVSSHEWQLTGRRKTTPFLLAQRCRTSVIHFYRTLELKEETFAFIVAVTLGNKSYLSDNIKESFRASGTAHLLAVSGLHTGIIYLVLSLLLSPFGKRGSSYLIKQWIIILMLWGYAFLTGLSSSVIRAVIMLSFYIIGRIRHEISFTTNTLSIAAFLILIFHPYSLFDISFQMSFGAVFSILWFQPRMLALAKPRNKYISYVWGLLTVSLSAQLGIFPLILYYFGTFPTWFLFTNIIAVPLMGGIIYALIPSLIIGWMHSILPSFPESLLRASRQLIQMLTDGMFHVIRFVESLPFSQLTGLHLSLAASVMLLLFIFLFSHCLILKRNRAQVLILSLLVLLSFQLIILKGNLQTPPPQLVVFNSYRTSDISLYYNHKRIPMDVPDNGLVSYPHKVVLRLSDDSFNRFSSETSFPVDILILSHYCCFKTEQLCNLFNPSLIVIDSSMSGNAATLVSNQCATMGVPVYDVRQKGAFSLNF